MSKYYVYAAYGLEGELLYVGKGSGERYKHCLNGTSSNKSLNRYYFKNGEDSSISVKILHTNLDEKEAFKLEKLEITTKNPIFNVKDSKVNQEDYLLRVKSFYSDFESKLIVKGLKKYSPHYNVWTSHMRLFVGKIGYGNLIDGVSLSHNSVRNYRDKTLENLFKRLVRGQTNEVFSSAFTTKKVCDNSGTYFIKLVT